MERTTIQYCHVTLFTSLMIIIGPVAHGDGENNDNNVVTLVAATVMGVIGVHQSESFYSCSFFFLVLSKKETIKKHNGSCGKCNLCKTMQVFRIIN